MADQTWRGRPASMSEKVWSAAATRIAEHAARYGLAEIRCVFHGGEPLLAGIDRILAIATAVRTALPTRTAARMALQTNGVLLDESTLPALQAHDIHIGVSLDGTANDHDRHRHHVSGRGSFSEVDRALRLLSKPEYRPVSSGILATIDPHTDPVACYEALLTYHPGALDFLLPHANWSTPHPACRNAEHPFGDWLVQLFDRWYDAPRQETRIRFFEEIIHVVLGGASQSESIGLSPAVVVVVETDGAIEQVDTLKSAYHGAADMGLSVLTDSFERALANPGIVARQIGVQALSDQCRQCTIHQICGGGQYPHRYRAGAGFRNPSVYCADLARLIGHVQQRITAGIQARGKTSP